MLTDPKCTRIVNFTETRGSGEDLPPCQNIPEYLRGSLPKNCSWQKNCSEFPQKIENVSLADCKWTLNCSHSTGVWYLAANRSCLTAQIMNGSKCTHCECQHQTSNALTKQCSCCDEGWTSPNFTHAMCYKSMSSVKKTLEEAIDSCKNESAVLARPFSDDDYPFIQNLTGTDTFTGQNSNH